MAATARDRRREIVRRRRVSIHIIRLPAVLRSLHLVVPVVDGLIVQDLNIEFTGGWSNLDQIKRLHRQFLAARSQQLLDIVVSD